MLARRFGIARGFDVYDDEFAAGMAERSARETTERALAHLQGLAGAEPLFLWVHYFDPHAPYEPPGAVSQPLSRTTPIGRKWPRWMNNSAGWWRRLSRAWRPLVDARRSWSPAITARAWATTARRGHGHLLYQSTMHVPMVVVGPGVRRRSVTTPVSTRRVFHTLIDWAGRPSPESLAAATPATEVVIGRGDEAVPAYGWQPQIMTVSGSLKAILSGRTRGVRRGE